MEVNKIGSKKLIFILVAFLVLINGFIFYNSLLDGPASNEQSGKIEEIVEPIVEAIVGQDHGWNIKWIVRKSAHLIEFAALGFSFSALALFAGAYWKRNIFPYGFFYLLAVAVADEFIQSFTGRTSAVSDVLIDFTGAMLGMLLCLLANRIIKKMKRVI